MLDAPIFHVIAIMSIGHKATIFSVFFSLILLLVGCDEIEVAEMNDDFIVQVDYEGETEVATFAAGCFWCFEAAAEQELGVIEAVSGYAGGEQPNPTYEQVYTQQTDHREAVQVVYDPSLIPYGQLLDLFWRSIDPTDGGGQFVDRGFSYTSAVFYHDVVQQEQAEASRKQLERSDRFEQPVVTPVLPFTTFYLAKEYHQDFYLKQPERYQRYAQASGRDEEFKALVWEAIEEEARKQER